jgi:hypothetical protein
MKTSKIVVSVLTEVLEITEIFKGLKLVSKDFNKYISGEVIAIYKNENEIEIGVRVITSKYEKEKILFEEIDLKNCFFADAISFYELLNKKFISYQNGQQNLVDEEA